MNSRTTFLLAVLAGLVLGGSTACPAGPVATVAVPEEPAAVAPAAADTAGIRDPFFAWCLRVVAGDSLGSWQGRELRRRWREAGRRTRLPVRWVESITREAVPPDSMPRAGGHWASRRWRIVLRRDLDVPMPYELFGYHPGRLLVSRRLVLSEWDLGRPLLRWRDGGGAVGEARCDLVRGLRLDEGSIVLDLDGWIDRLLGGKLDDTWTEALVVAHVTAGLSSGTGWTAVALGRSVKGTPMLGGFDFYRDRALDRGRPVHHALSRHCRPWIAPYRLTPASRVWEWPALRVAPQR